MNDDGLNGKVNETGEDDLHSSKKTDVRFFGNQGRIFGEDISDYLNRQRGHTEDAVGHQE